MDKVYIRALQYHVHYSQNYVLQITKLPYRFIVIVPSTISHWMSCHTVLVCTNGRKAMKNLTTFMIRLLR